MLNGFVVYIKGVIVLYLISSCGSRKHVYRFKRILAAGRLLI